MANGRSPELFGRSVIYSDVEKVNEKNVAEVLRKAEDTHNKNVDQINYLWDMYRGKQDVLSRQKEVRPDILHNVVENRAYQIVTFEVGYMVGKPITYIAADIADNEAVRQLNDYMVEEDKSTKDQSLVMWQKICGTAYRLVVQKDKNERGESPFEIYTVEPTRAFVVYSSRVGHRPLCGVYFYKNEDGDRVYCVYTPTEYFEVVKHEVTKKGGNALGLIPIIEYPANDARLGSPEVVAPLLNELNDLDSSRIEGVEQIIQALLVFVNCQPPGGETSATLQEKGIIAVKSVGENKADIKTITEKLDQAQTQVLKDDIYQAILEIVGMPSMSNGNTSDSSNNGAVILKNGWQNAEAKAEAAEQLFKRSERDMLRVVIRICRDLADLPPVSLADVQIHFGRQNYGDIQSKAQVLVMMLNNDKIHPKLAFEACGMFKDVEDAYAMSEEYVEEEVAALNKRLGDATRTVE